MKLKSIFSPAFFSLSLATAIMACGGGGAKEGEGSEEFDKAGDEVTEEIDQVLHDIPSPSEVPYRIEATGADFNESLLNDLARVEDYTSDPAKAALNLGVYGTDIGYLASYGKSQEALNYLKEGVQPLAVELNIDKAFDIEILKQFERNLDDRDSLALIIDKGINQAHDYLSALDQNKLVVQTIAGSFIEGIYITTQIVAQYPGEGLTEEQVAIILSDMVALILEQEKSLDELIGLIDAINTKGEYLTEINSKLKEVQASYKELNVQEAIRNNQAEAILDNAMLKTIIEQMAAVRAMVID